MNLTQKQKEALLNRARYKVLNFGRRSGKTTELAQEAVVTSQTVEDATISYYAQTFGDARDIAWKIFLEAFEGAIIHKNETLLELTVKSQKGIAKITLRGWESVVTSEKGRGTENDLLLLDEVAFCRGFKHYWEKVLEPTLLTTRGRVVFSSTPNGFNDFYDLSNFAQNTKDWFYVHATSYDNPFNDKHWLDERIKTLPEDVFAQEYLADFRKTEGLVFKEFSREKHLYDELPAGDYDKLAGIDFGFRNPTAVMEVQWNGKALYIESEWYKTGRTDAQVAEYVGTCNFNAVYPDPENAGAIEELRRKGVNVREVKKGKGSILEGIQMMRELFLSKRLFINRKCVNLIFELETYTYEKDSKKELPKKENDHACDSLRYVVLALFPKIDKQRKILRDIGKDIWMNQPQTNPT